jgi:soluble lytic murein transglycosylase-like protein
MIAVEQVAAAVEHVESRGHWYAKRGGCLGVMQVCPQWAHVPRAWLWLPEVNRAEGQRLLIYWLGKAHGHWLPALAAYNCGWNGLTGKCGTRYARRVMLRVRLADTDT